jgi:hypothetical protein
MKDKTQITVGTLSCVIVAIALVWAFVFPSSALAQCPSGTSTTCGYNAVFNSSGPVPSAAFIDASAFSTSGDICTRIHAVLTNGYPASGEVIDARGIIPTQPCLTNPWATVTAPSTVLLPAGTIQLAAQWVLPNGTRIIGMGAGKPGTAAVTNLQAQSGFPSGMALIRMGTTASDQNISVEDLRIDGGTASVNGITNAFGHEGSYVRRVSFVDITANALSITSGAANSGPYSDISFFNSSLTAICVSIQAPSRGIHGLRCSGNSSSIAPAAVLLDSPGNFLEDVQIDNFTDGVAIGKRSPTQNDALFNIQGGSNVTNVIHIFSAFSVSDINVMAVGAGGATNTIADDQTRTTLAASSKASVGVYILGERVGPGFSRFTTSPDVPTWVSGNAAIPASTSCSQSGSLYSNTTGTSGGGDTWYVCEGSPSKWANIF